MKINNILQLVEAPLPDDWNKGVYNNPKKFSDIVQYANNRATAIATGSSRVAFAIDYQGRNTVLKVAINARGLQQNSEEVKLLSSNYIRNSGIAIPMIDHDTDNPQPTWIHMEFAEPAGVNGAFNRKFDIFFDFEFETMLDLVLNGGDATSWMDDIGNNQNALHYYDTLLSLKNDYGVGIVELLSSDNWGWYNSKPVVIDLGYAGDAIKLYNLPKDMSDEIKFKHEN